MSTEPDPLLRALGEVERDYDEKYPAVWEDVLAGRAPAAAAAGRAAVDPEHAMFAAMFAAEIDEAEVQRLVARAAAGLSAGAAEAETTRDGVRRGEATRAEVARGEAEVARAEVARGEAARVEAQVARAEVVRGEATGGEVVALRRRVVIAVAAVLAIAAALVLWQLPREGPRGPVIAYALTVRNPAVQSVRTADAAGEVARYTRGSTIDWVLSPERPRGEEVALRVVARAPDGAETAVSPVFTRSPDGALRLRGRLGEVLPLAPGRWQLRFEVDEREVGDRLEISLAD